MSKLEIIAWLLFASFGGVGGLRSDLSLFIMAGNVPTLVDGGVCGSVDSATNYKRVLGIYHEILIN